MRWKLLLQVLALFLIIIFGGTYFYLLGIPVGEIPKPEKPKLGIMVLPTHFITDDKGFNQLSINRKIKMSAKIIKELNQGFRIASENKASVAPWMAEWGELEKSKGNYDWLVLDLINHFVRRQNMELAFELNLINTNVLADYPDDIQFKGFDDAVFRNRAKDFVRRLAERYKGDIRYFWIGNEVNEYLQNNPDQLESFLTLYDELEKQIKTVDPNITTGLYVAYHLFREENKQMVRIFAEKSDAIALSVYPDALPAVPDGKRHIENVSQTAEYFEEILENTYPAKVAVAETGWSTRGPYGSTEKQSQYVREIFNVLKKHENRFVYLTWATLYDLSEQSAKEVAGEINELEDLETRHRQFLNWLSSSGLMTEDHKEKPALRIWREEIALLDGGKQ